MDDDMNMDSTGFGLQPAFEHQPAQVDRGDPNRKQLQVHSAIIVPA